MPKRARAHTNCFTYMGGCLFLIVGIPLGLALFWVIGLYILAGAFIVLTLAVIVITLGNGLFSQ